MRKSPVAEGVMVRNAETEGQYIGIGQYGAGYAGDVKFPGEPEIKSTPDGVRSYSVGKG